MQNFILDLLVVIGVCWLVEKLLGTFKIKDPANQIIMAVTLVVLVLWLVSAGLPLLHR